MVIVYMYGLVITQIFFKSYLVASHSFGPGWLEEKRDWGRYRGSRGVPLFLDGAPLFGKSRSVILHYMVIITIVYDNYNIR